MAQHFQQQGQSQQAIKAWQACLSQQPDFVQAALGLARLLYRHDQIRAAGQVLQQCYRQGGYNFEMLHMLGALQHLNRNFDAADKPLRHALELRPDAPQTNTLLGANLIEQGQFTTAISRLKRTLAHTPYHADAHNNLAWAYRAIGERALALQHFIEAYRIEPKAIDALCGWLLLAEHTQSSEQLEAARHLLKQGKLSPRQRMSLCFALGKAAEDQGTYQDAFALFQEGNQLWQRLHSYDLRADIALFDQIKKIDYTPHSHHPPGTPTPVFIVGMPRSGTSLVEQILASHSHCEGAGELAFWEQALLSESGQFLWPPQQHKTLPERYMATLTGNRAPARCRYISDKMPLNFRFIGAIKAVFPGAKIIHCRRDPRDNCLSLYKHLFPGFAHPYSYRQEDLIGYYRLYENLMVHWHEHYANDIFDVQYEQLVGNFTQQATRLCGFLGLELEEACYDFHRNTRPVRTASSEQVRQALYDRRVGHWHHYAEHLAPILNEFGRH